MNSVLFLLNIKNYRITRPVQGMVSDKFLSKRNLSAADIHRQIYEVYEVTTMCEGKE